MASRWLSRALGWEGLHVGRILCSILYTLRRQACPGLSGSVCSYR